VHCEKNGLTIVSLNDLFYALEVRQIENPVPFEEQIVVLFELVDLSDRELSDFADSSTQNLSKHGPYSNTRLGWRWQRV
jgi:hypothetical protein